MTIRITPTALRGIRREGTKDDIYKLAKKLFRLRLLE